MIAQKNPSRFAAQSRRAEDVSADTKEASPASHEQFLQMMPSIVRHARIRFRCLSPAMRKDAVDDVVCLAFAAYARLVELGKEDIAYATPLAGYAVAQFRAGRRVGLRRNTRDLLSDACRRRHGLTIERVDRFDRTSGEWQEVLVEDRRFGPADAAATRIDFTAWLKSLTKRNRRLAEKLATGESTEGAARSFKLSAARISQLRRELAHSWHLFQAELAPAAT